MKSMTAHFVFKEGKDYSVEFPKDEQNAFIEAIKNDEVYRSESGVVSYVNPKELKGYFFFNTTEKKEESNGFGGVSDPY